MVYRLYILFFYTVYSFYPFDTTKYIYWAAFTYVLDAAHIPEVRKFWSYTLGSFWSYTLGSFGVTLSEVFWSYTRFGVTLSEV